MLVKKSASAPNAPQRAGDLIGLARLTRLAFNGDSLEPVRSELARRVRSNPDDATAWLDLSTIAELEGRPNLRRVLQQHALELERVYRQPTSVSDPIRLLALVAPGDFLANMPIEFMLEGSNIVLITAYVLAEQPLPGHIPEHDVALVAISQTSRNEPLLNALAAITDVWPRPIVNAPERIARLTRDGTWALLKSTPNVHIPMTVRIFREDLDRVGQGAHSVRAVLGGSNFPIIARPLDSHSGDGLAKLDDGAAIGAFLQERTEAEFYISPFVDYRSADGLYRKYRVALIGGRPYACHMAISEHWMVHYFNAEMTTRAERRAEEARFIADFDDDFSVRHQAALKAIGERLDLDYVPIDCGETADGRLLVFEVGTNMIIHALDPPDLFPYKGEQMQKLFRAFHAMLVDASRKRVSDAEVQDSC
jgi:glutathione synthase/RimK-type ligase-like ATP-grasp enzyme